MTNSNAFLFQPDAERSAAQGRYDALLSQSQGGIWPVLTQGALCAPEERLSRVRFLNAAPGLRLNVAIDRQPVSTGLEYQALSDYQGIEGGFRLLTVVSAGNPRGAYLRQSIPFVPGETVTYVLIPSRGRLELVRVPDALCLSGGDGGSCLRMANFCPHCGPLELSTEEGEAVFTGVLFKETTAFRQIRPGEYLLSVGTDSRPPLSGPLLPPSCCFPNPGEANPLTDFSLSVRPASAYTVFVLDSGSVLVSEDAAQPI